MPRKPTPRTSDFPIHVVARSNNRDWFSLETEHCWEIFARQVELTATQFGFKTFIFVLMSNHYHWLLSTPHANLGEGMCRFQSEVSWAIARSSHRINHVFGGRYRPSVITCPVHYANVYRYIAQNPLRAGISKNIHSYGFSTEVDKKIRTESAGMFEFEIPTGEGRDTWLNKIPPGTANESIRYGLRRSTFKLPRHGTKKVRITGREFL